MVKEIRLEDELDRWRWVCPNGHRSWEPTNRHFWCPRCAENDGVDGVFDELRNRATEECYVREELTFVGHGGPARGPRSEESSRHSEESGRHSEGST